MEFMSKYWLHSSLQTEIRSAVCENYYRIWGLLCVCLPQCAHVCECTCVCLFESSPEHVCLCQHIMCVSTVCSYAVERVIPFSATSIAKPLNVPNATLTACQWLYVCVSQSIEPINKKKACSQGKRNRSTGTHSATLLQRPSTTMPTIKVTIITTVTTSI